MDALSYVLAKKLAESGIGEKGDKGDAGNGIASTVLNDDYTLTLTFTNGTSYTTPPIRGEKGEVGAKGDTGSQGVQGIQGEKGEPGTNGIDGRFITSINLTTDASGIIVGGTATLSDNSIIDITITTTTV